MLIKMHAYCNVLFFSMGVEWFGFGYAALVATGGVIGYVKAGMFVKPRSLITRVMYLIIKG